MAIHFDLYMYFVYFVFTLGIDDGIKLSADFEEDVRTPEKQG